jgi:serine/threonine protein kinase
MNDPVATVEPNPQNAEHDLRPTEPGGSRQAGATPGRFTYPGGSRPLSGFTIKRGIGHGGFGEVYYAQSDGGKEVALKLIRRNLDVELRGIKHCLNLKNPNLLSIHDIREDEQGDTWVVMEYITDKSLEDVVADNAGGLPAEDALRWFHGIGAGVAYLHDHGIVHRDLKPGNIFSDEGVVKVGDYGLSKFISCSRRSGQTESVGTVHYMAPEVANGRYGKEIDIYALGVILYEMLTGRVPFEGESVGEVLMKHLTAPPDVSVLDEPYRSVVARALEKDPASRFGSVAEMLAQLPRPLGEQPQAGPIPSSATTEAAGTAAGGSPFIKPVPVAEEVVEEPIYREVRRFCLRAHQAWNESNLNTPAKIIILVVGLFALLTMAGGLVPLVFSLLAAYAVYWVFWKFFLSTSPRFGGRSATASSTSSPPPSPAPQAAATAKTGRWRRSHRRRRSRQKEKAAEWLMAKPKRVRVAELFGSLVGAALVAITICLVMIILFAFRGALPRVEQTAWLMLMSIAGAWTILIPSKFWEGDQGDAMLRRFIMMTFGMGLGVLAYGMAAFLQLELPYDQKFADPHGYDLPANFYDGPRPLLLAYVACFGTLFMLVRWWRQADPLRGSRMSIWSLVFCVTVAGLVAFLWRFPQPWLMLAACGISTSVQLASPWMHPRRRQELSQEE